MNKSFLISSLFNKAPTASFSNGTSAKDLSQNFLKMLTVQLQNQDPLNPMDNAAMTAQLAASRSVDWPEALRPNGLFLVTHTGDMTSVVLDGALSNLWATPQDAAAKGWTPELARRFLSLLDPLGPLPVPAAHVVSILGKRDTVLPFASGRDLVECWGVPGSNLFIWDRGHFSVPATLIRRTEPLERLAAVARALS